MTVRNKDKTEEKRVVVQGRTSLEDHPHLLSPIQRKSIQQQQQTQQFTSSNFIDTYI